MAKLTQTQRDSIVAKAIAKIGVRRELAKKADVATSRGIEAKLRAGARKSASGSFGSEQVAVAAAGSVVKAMPVPTESQVEEFGGGAIGFIRARRALQRS